MDKERKPVSNIPSGTGGAVPIRNEKGEITMQKVKVHRYVAGKRPKYAPDDDDDEEEQESEESSKSEEEDDEEEEDERARARYKALSKKRDIPASSSNDNNDRRLRRLMEAEKDVQTTRERPVRHREVAEPEILHEEEADNQADEVKVEDEEEEELSEEQRMQKRLELKKKALQRQEELLGIEEEQNQKSSDESETEESEYEDEEYSDSEDEVVPRLKPVFVRKSDRVTIQEKEMQLEKEKEIEREKELLHLEAKKQTRKIIEEEVIKEKNAEKETNENIQCDFNTDDENNENEYEEWKLRELKRIKRDRDEREKFEREKQEIQKLRNMTEEERLAYLKTNPKVLVNKAKKGKYKYLQKYFHRGAFFMDKDDEVFKRNFAEPTLEDHFDKTILPKVMQVKNFGMSGRTKYTHLADQDTTRKEDNPWSVQETFIQGKGGGTKQTFDKPTTKKVK